MSGQMKQKAGRHFPSRVSAKTASGARIGWCARRGFVALSGAVRAGQPRHHRPSQGHDRGTLQRRRGARVRPAPRTLPRNEHPRCRDRRQNRCPRRNLLHRPLTLHCCYPPGGWPNHQAEADRCAVLGVSRDVRDHLRVRRYQRAPLSASSGSETARQFLRATDLLGDMSGT